MTKANAPKSTPDAAAKKSSRHCVHLKFAIKQIANKPRTRTGSGAHGSEFHHLLWNETSGRWTGRLSCRCNGKILMFEWRNPWCQTVAQAGYDVPEWLRENIPPLLLTPQRFCITCPCRPRPFDRLAAVSEMDEMHHTK